MDPRLAPLAELLRLNARLFGNCLVGLTEEAVCERPSVATNSAAFVAAHLVDSRYYILHILGAPEPSPLKGATGGFNDIANVITYPSLAEIRAAWTTVSDTLARQLERLTAAQLDAAIDPGFPVENQTLLGLLTFMVQHDSYHLGQLGLLRKYAGQPAMAY